MAEFDSWQSFWSFAHSVKREARYVFEGSVDRFLEAVVATSESRRMSFPIHKYLWRAQLGHDWRAIEQDGEKIEVPACLPPDRMKPLPDFAREGRVNPKGIPCFTPVQTEYECN